MSCHPARARDLLKKGKAVVFRQYPFTVILKERIDGATQPLRLKIDPGSKVTGIAITTETGKIVFATEIHHRGQQIKFALDSRRAIRRGRRSRKTRYRVSRFLNRTRNANWLPPSIMSRVDNINTWVNRFRRFAPISALSIERVRFDLQKMENPEISGIEYQRGTLYGFEVKEYLLLKWGHKCVYCKKKDIPLQIEHITPRARGGTNRASNLTLSCAPCNLKKGTMTATEFGYPEIQKEAKAPLKDATAINVSRWVLFERLKATGLPIEVGSGGRTKYNRTNQNLPKNHWIDAACVGESGASVVVPAGMSPLSVKASGHGNRKMCGTDRFGFPTQHRTRNKLFLGFRTGDMVKADIPSGKYAGVHIGKITIRQRPSFKLNGFGVHPKYLKIIHRQDGYAYEIIITGIHPNS